MQDDIGDLPEYDDSDLDSSGIELAAPTTVFGPFPTAEDIQKHGSFWELKSATGRTLRVKFEDGRTERCQVKVQVALVALGGGYSAQSARRTHTIGVVPPNIMARPVTSFDTLLGAAPFYLGSVARCKTTGITGFVLVADIRSFSSADSLLSLFEAQYTYRVAWCEKHPAAVSPVDEESLDFLGLPDRPLHTDDSAAQYLAGLQQFLRTTPK